jgi:hypothetical protein
MAEPSSLIGNYCLRKAVLQFNNNTMPKIVPALLISLLHTVSGAVEVRFEKVTEGV